MVIILYNRPCQYRNSDYRANNPKYIIFNIELMLGLNYIHVIELELLCCVQISRDIFLKSLYRMYVNVQYGAHIQSFYCH